MDSESTNILVVDDDVAMRFMVSEALQQSGHCVQEAGDGVQALEALKQNQFDIILLDAMMPNMDGYEFCAKLRATEGDTHTPVLMMTGLDDLAAIHRAFEVGATDFISKPLNYIVLGYRVQYMLRTKATADLLRKNDLLLTRAQSLAQLGHWEWHVGMSNISCSRETIRILGLEEFVTKHSQSFIPTISQKKSVALPEIIDQALEWGEAFQSEKKYCHPDGSTKVLRFDVQVTCVDEAVTEVMGTVHDITSIRKTEDEVRYLAYYDSVTGLPNRRFLLQYLQFNLDVAKRHKQSISLLFLDLDNFKRINDTMGHEVGDQLLQGVSERLCQCVRASDVVTYEIDSKKNERQMVESDDDSAIVRLGGDEFVVVLNGTGEQENVATIAQRIITSLSEPFEFNNQQLVITTSLGISSFPEDSLDVLSMLQNADTAMYHAKEQGKNRYQYFNNEIQQRAMLRLSIETDLRKALENDDELVLFYQPKISLKTGAVIGAEALIRWNHPEKGLIPPFDFIEIAEECGLIVPLGEWVIQEACRQASQWCDLGLSTLTVSVNISARQFKSENFEPHIKSVLAKTKLPQSNLELELTESLFMDDLDKSIQIMQRLKKLDLKLSIDDFGTGYSSLSYIAKFPLDTLKMDKSFIDQMLDDPASEGIIDATIAMSHKLGYTFIAEGIETPEQLARLIDLGCDEVQGYYFSRPVPAAECYEWIINYQNKIDHSANISRGN